MPFSTRVKQAGRAPPVSSEMMVYAQNTDVSSVRSRNDIERTLQRYGADGFGYVYEGNIAAVMFAMAEGRVRFLLQIPIVQSSGIPTIRRPGSAARKRRMMPTSRPAARSGARCCW